MSSFMKIFACIFASETIIFGLIRLLQAEALWPQALVNFTPPENMALTVAVFSVIVYAVSNIGVVREMTRIADLYFDAPDQGEGRVWPFPAFRARERSIAIAMIIVLVLINQGQVGISVRLSFLIEIGLTQFRKKCCRVLVAASLRLYALGFCLCCYRCC